MSHARQFFDQAAREAIQAHRFLLAFKGYRAASPDERAEQVLGHLDYTRAAIAATPSLCEWQQPNSGRARREVPGAAGWPTPPT